MAVRWINDGEPVNGVVTAEIDLGDGSRPQVFRGADYREVADKLLQAQDHASAKIRELRAAQQPDKAPARPAIVPRPMTNGERMQVAVDLTDPAKAERAVGRIVEAAIGHPDAIRDTLKGVTEGQAEREAAAEAEAFVAATPDWYASAHNKATLVNYLKQEKLDPTRNNLTIAFERLKELGLIQFAPRAEQGDPDDGPEPSPQPQRSNPKPEEQYPEPIPPIPAIRPRSVATGVRASDHGHQAPRTGKPRYTRREIEEMPNSVYRAKLLNEPGFAEFVNSMTAVG